MKHSKTLKLHLENLDLILVSAKTIHEKKSDLNLPEAEQALLSLAMKGAIISSFSEVELYIENFLGLWFDNSINKSSFKKFFSGGSPTHLKALYFKLMFKDSFQQYFLNNDETAFFKKISSSPHFKNITLSPENEFLFRGNSLYIGKKYPSAKNLSALGKRLGIQDIFKAMSDIKTFPWQSKLDSLNSTRTGVAHRGELPVGYGSKDTILFINDTIDFLKTLEPALKEHIKAHMTTRAWSAVSKKL